MQTVLVVDIQGTRVHAAAGDLTAAAVDAIVNAANRQLQHGGGVAAAIARAGGPTIQQESNDWVAAHGPLKDGEAARTSGGDLAAAHVIHVAGPVYDPDRDDNEPRLRAAVRAALDEAVAAEASSIAFPAISAGIYGYPREEATAVLTEEVASWIVQHPRSLDEVWLVGFDHDAAGDFAAALRRTAERGQPA